MPKRVEEVRLRTERVLLNRLFCSSSGLDVLERSLSSRESVGGVFGEEDSFDLASSSKGRRGLGRSRLDVSGESVAIVSIDRAMIHDSYRQLLEAWLT